ncbi:MAG: hypothetical protein LWW86_09425 [Micrococcales bacterium]|nr:hypothetical protein [Micrococcales bacterium]
MTDDPAGTAPTEDELQQATDVEVLDVAEAAAEVQRAVSGRRGMARRYVIRVRRRNPVATPGDLVKILERHYLAAISAAGAALTVGSLAAEIGISLIPGGSAATKGGKVAAKAAGKAAAKTALKNSGKKLLKNAAKEGGTQALSTWVPAGEKQLQFEVTALFALALAELHDLDLDEQSSAELVRRLTDGDPGSGDSAGSMVRSLVSDEDAHEFRAQLSRRQGAALDMSSKAVSGGAHRFVFGEAPANFPPHLAVPVEDADEDGHGPLAALEQAARSVGDTAGARAHAVGTGITNAASSVSRPFRSVDRDGDGVADEPAALSAAKHAGTVIAGRTGAVGKKLRAPLKGRRRGAAGEVELEDAATDDPDTDDHAAE